MRDNMLVFPWSLLRRAGFDKGELRNLAIRLGQAMGCALICATVSNWSLRVTGGRLLAPGLP